MSDEIPRDVTDRTIGQYLAALGSSEPTPGGGSASGVVGSLACGLGLMVVALTDLDGTDAADELRSSQKSFEALQDRFTELAREDERVYQSYLNAANLAKGTEEEKSIRKVAMQDALKKAASVPLAMCEACVDLSAALSPVREHGNRYLVADAQVAEVFANACFDAARVLVEANLAVIKDADWVEEIAAHLDDLARRLTVGAIA